MSRVTPPVTKVVHAIRNISSSAQAARSSVLLESHTQQAKYLPRRLADLKSECNKRQLKTAGSKSELVDRLVAHDLTRSHSTLGVQPHRPAPEISAPLIRGRPLMQGFRTSAPKQAAHDNSTIDFVFFPENPTELPSNPYVMRVPLLPDNYTPDRSVGSPHELEALDEAVPQPEITVVASHPDNVVPAALTEVVNNAGLDVDIAELTKAFNKKVEVMEEASALKELWSDLMDDILGPKVKPAHG